MRRPTCSMSLLLGMAMLACFHANAGADAAGRHGPAASAKKLPDEYATIHNDFYWVDQNGADPDTQRLPVPV